MKKLKALLFCLNITSSLHISSMMQRWKRPISSIIVQTKKRLLHTSSHVSKSQYAPPFESERLKFYARIQQNKWGQVAQKYINRFEQDEKEFIKNLCIACPNMTLAKWESEKYALYPSFKQDQLNLIKQMAPLNGVISPGLPDKINKLICKLEIDPTAISILYDDSGSNVMEAGQSHLILFDAICKLARSENNHMSDAIILHELLHILHDDLFEANGLGHTYYRYKTSIDKNKFAELQKKFFHAKEMRADICVGLMDIKYAKALMLTYNSLPANLDKESVTHPSLSTRIEYLRKLYQEMLNVIKK